MFRSLSLLHDFDSIFNNLLVKDLGMSIKETSEYLELELDVPGVKKEDINLYYDHGYLSLEWTRNKNKNKRQWYVGNTYDFNNVIVNLDLGVLYLKVPLQAQHKPTKINLLK